MDTTDQTVQKVALKTAQEFIASKTLRTYKGFEDRDYVLDLELTEDKDGLEVTTWGYDYETFPIPQNWHELVNFKMRASFGWMHPSEIAYRFYYEIMKKFN